MRFAPLWARIAAASSEAQLRSTFMEHAGEWVGATAWGIDLLDSHFQVIESELCGLPDAFCDRYQAIGRSADVVSQRMLQHHIPVHTLSRQSVEDWRQSPLYQQVFRVYGIEHGMVAPLIGNGRLIGGIYFLRGKTLPAFNDNDLIQLSSLCQHLSVRLATLRLPIQSSLIGRLTPRELNIVELVSQGLSNREIALKLYISRDAVKQSLKRIFRKVGVSTRVEMIVQLRPLTPYPPAEEVEK